MAVAVALVAPTVAAMPQTGAVPGDETYVVVTVMPVVAAGAAAFVVTAADAEAWAAQAAVVVGT